ncbi:MAG: cyclic lactone autoinducer peptide [Clostridiales bacterium]|nr:cyclic lactone autoinducer peptide [Clostridiales bacterium]
MLKKFSAYLFSVMSLGLIAFADIATSANTILLHGEPDCPEELLK